MITAAWPLAVGMAVFVLHDGEGIDSARLGIICDALASTIEIASIVVSVIAVLFFIFLFFSSFNSVGAHSVG